MAGLSSATFAGTACAFIIACSNGGDVQHATGTPGDASGTGGSGAEAGPIDDPDPVITDGDRTALEALRYDPGSPPQDPSNRVADDATARTLGQTLFFDASLSGRLLEPDNDGNPATLGKEGEAGRVSCAGCHLPAGFIDTRSPHRQISLAAQWTRRRTPTLLDASFFPLYNWDGRRDSIWTQAIGVMESAVEFNSSRLFVAEQVFRLHRPDYEAVFGAMPPLDDAQRFPQLDPLQAGCDPGPAATAACRGKPGDKADYDGMAADAQTAVTTIIVNAAKSIAAYVRALRCGSSRFDQWLDGDATALNRSEQRGAALFVGAGKCVTCHSGPHFADGKFHNVGLRPATVAVAFTDTDDRGAAEGLALALEDPLNSKGAFSDGDRGVLPAAVGVEFEGAFKTPTLRCISDHPSFMHTGQLTSLEQVVRFFSRGGDSAGFPGTNEIGSLGLSDREQADLVAFVQALQGPGPEAALLAPPAN
jgi:cytochrome c peroxidase